MVRKFVYSTVVLLLACGTFSSLHAQKFELHPYAGGFFPRGDFSNGVIKHEGIYGLKGSVALTKAFALEGNFGYINHFRNEFVDTPSRAALFEGAGVFQFPWGRLKPFATAGVGAMRGVVSKDVLNLPTLTGQRTTILDGNQFTNGDTFFMVSYGGGVKAERLWGPVGLRADVRGRTLPNIFGTHMTWLETTGGLTFSWGE